MIKEHYGITELSVMLGLPKYTVRAQVRRGEIPCVRCGARGDRRVRASTIADMFPECWKRYLAESEEDDYE